MTVPIVIAILILPSAAGRLASDGVAATAFAVAHTLAQGGPIFPAPPTTLLVAVPIALFLLLVQGLWRPAETAGETRITS